MAVFLEGSSSAYADDLTGSGTIDGLKTWWDMVIEWGPLHWVLRQTIQILAHCEARTPCICEGGVYITGSGLQITTQGQRHLGAVVGSEQFKTK